MIIRVFKKSGQNDSSYSFKQKTVIVGRNPTQQCHVIIDSQSVSRNHLKIKLKNHKIYVEDLKSSNGTYINGQEIKPNQKVQLTKDDKIKIAQYDGYLIVELRSSEKNKQQKKRKSSSEQQSQESSRQRSRQKQKKPSSKIQIAQSSLKMLRTMTADKKSKAQKIKFLKLMGYSQAEQCWDEIQQLILSKKTFFITNANKKTTMQLEKQFSQSRSGHQKKGLGR